MDTNANVATPIYVRADGTPVYYTDAYCDSCGAAAGYGCC